MWAVSFLFSCEVLGIFAYFCVSKSLFVHYIYIFFYYTLPRFVFEFEKKSDRFCVRL